MAKKKKKEIETGRILGRINDDGSITPFIQKQQEEEIAPVKDTWLKKGALNDSGYAIQNPLDAINRFNASILMTGVDALGQFGKGFLGSAEGVSDIAKTTTADVLDFFGADNKAKKLRKSAEKTWGINEELDKSLIDDNGFGIDDMSLLGQKGKSVPQGLGTTMFSMTTGSVLGGAGGMALLGLSAAGNSEQEAIKEMKANQDINGFSDKEIYKNAKLYGLLSGTAEAATEMMFGAAAQGSNLLGIGTGAFDSADDAVINALTKKISNKLVKTFTQAGLKASSEGIEEVASGMLDALAKKITYQKDKKYWTELLKDENLLDSFLSGTFSAALSQAPSVARNVTTTENGKVRLRNNNEIRDFLTNLNEQEQQVVEREIENRIGQEEKATKKRRIEIEKQVIEDLDRGYINANTIRDVLGENYNAERDVRLNESFNEETRRTQAYENDLSKYDEKQRKTIQTAIDSGLLNNSNKTHDLVDLIAKLSADKGVDFDFTNNQRIKESGFAIDGKQINGFIKDGKVTLNLESNQVLNKTVGHEITHVLEGTELYNSLQDSLKSFIGEREWNNRISELEKTYKDVKGANIENELTSDLVGEYVFNDESFVKSLSTKNPNLFQKIFDEIKYMVKIATAGSKEARDLEKVKRAFEKAYRETSKTQKGTQYSLSTQQQLNDITNQRDSLRQELLELRKERGEITKTIPDYSMFKQYDELTDINKKIDDNLAKSKELYAKQEELKNKLEEEKEIKKKQEIEEINKKSTPFKEKQFKVLQKSNPMLDDYHTGIRQPGEIMTWEEAINDADESGEGYSWGDYTKEDALRDLDRKKVTIYSSYPIKNGTFVTPSRAQAEMYAGGEGSSVYSKTVNPDFVAWINVDEGQYANVGRNIENNTKYSLTDNQGRELSKEQQEYFKDSKLRNENGELEVVYHTTPNQFTVFNSEKAGENTGYDNTAFGSFVTTNRNFSERFGDINEEGTKGNTMEMYANITNPITHPYNAEYKYSGEQLDNIVENWFNAIGETEALEELKSYVEDGEYDSLYQAYRNTVEFSDESPFEYASDERERLQEKGYDGVEFVEGLDKDVNYNVSDSNEPVSSYAVFDSNQLKNIDNSKPTTNEDIRYSLTDNQGRQLSEQQQEFFKDSKVRDDEGNLKEVYHRTYRGGFNVFENKKGIHFFTDDADASYYGDNRYNVYLNITNPLVIDGEGKNYNQIEFAADGLDQYNSTSIKSVVDNIDIATKEDIINLAQAIDSNNSLRDYIDEFNTPKEMLDSVIEAYDEGATLEQFVKDYGGLSMFTENDNIPSTKVTNTQDITEYAKANGYDGVIFNNIQDKTNGAATVYATFESNQAKNIDNTNPTSNPDIRYSLSEDAETFKTPYGVEVVKNPSTDDYIQMRQDILEEYPWLRGEKILRQTYDEEGNVYYWNAYDAQHTDVEPYINKKYNTRTFQNDGWWKNPIYKDSPKDYSYVDTSNFKYSLSEAPKQDNQGRELTKNQQEFYKNVSPEVRDENGNLMSFYHGSNSEFTIFDITKSGESSKEAKVGFWFTPNKKGAENFANEVWYGDKTPTTYEVYLNIKNPKVYETYEVDQQQRDSMIQNRKNIEQEIRDSSHKYSWTETGDYKVTSLYNDLVEMNRREKNGIRFKEDAQYNEDFYRRLAAERNISNEKFNEMNQDAKNQVELETQKRKADDEFYSYVYSDAYEQFKTDLYLSAGMRAEDANVGGMGMMMKNENEAVANFVEGLKQEGYDGIVIKNTHYDNDSLGEGKNNNQYVAFYPNQIKNVTNENPTENDDIRYQLGNNEVAPTSGWNVRSEDVRLQSAFKDTIAPLQEQVQQLTDTITRLEDRIAPIKEEREDIETRSEGFVIDKINDLLWRLQGKKDRYFGLTKPDMELLRNTVLEDRQNRAEYLNDFINNLTQKIVDNSNADVNVNEIKEELSSNINDYLDEYRALTEQEADELYQETQRGFENEVAPIRENLTPEENQRMDMLELLERNNMMNDERRYEKEQLENKINPVYPTEEATPGQALSDIRDIDEVGKRDVKAYQYEHPEVKPYFQEEARGMLSDLRNSQKGERYIYESQERGQGTNYDVLANKRFTSPEIAELLDSKWGYTYDDIEKGLNAIIEDHGAENIAIAKRIELVLDDNLRNGYTDWQTGMEVPPNQQYLNMLAEQEWQNYFDDINSQYPLEQLQEPQYNPEDEETDFSDVKIDKDIQDMTVDDLNLEPFLQGLVKADERQKARQEIAKEVGNRKEYTPKKKGLIGKAIDLYKSLTNEFAVVDEFAKDVKNPTITHKIDTWNNYVPLAQTNITTAQTDINGKAIGRSWNSIWEEANKLGIAEKLDEYVKHWSNIDRGKRGKGALDYSAKESYKKAQEIKSQYPDVHRLAKDIWQFSRNERHNLRDAGTISQQVSDILGSTNPHYIPFVSDNISNYFTETGELKPRRTIKRAKGGAELEGLLSVEEAMKSYIYSQFDEATGNRAFLEIVKSSPNQFVLGGDDRTSYVNQDHLSVDKDGYYLTAYENGEPITARISKEMYDSLSRQTKHRVDEFVNKYESILKPIEKFGNLRRKMLTELSPSFLLKNPGKDFQEAVINSKYTKDMIANYMNPQTWIELANGTGEADIFRNNYGSGLVMGQYDIDISEIDPKSKNFNFLKKLGNANEYMELITRYAEFKASRQNGASIQEAMYNAREVTTNFSRGNPIVKAFNKYGMTFLNSSVQGFDKFIRNFSGENGAKGIVNSLAKAAIFGIAPAVFNELAFGSGDDKDEEYEALPDYIKDNYYIIKTGDGNFIRIPKGRVLSVFGSAARRTIEAMEGEENAFEGYWNNVQQQIGVNNPEENNIFAPLIQAMGGRKLDSGQTAGSAWYGGDIIPTRLQKEHPEDQHDASIDKFSIWLGQKTGISPYKINYVLDQYSGGIGDLALPMFTEEANSDADNVLEFISSGIKDQFKVDTITDNKYVSEFYDTYNKLYSGSKKNDEDVLKENYMTNISKQMGELYAERREIQADTTLSKKEKYEKAQTIKAEINRLAKEGLDNYENISITGDYADVDGQEYQRTDDGWRKLSSNTSDEVNSLGLTNREKNNYIKTQKDISNIKKKYKDTDDYVGKKQDIIGEIINTNLTDDAKMSLYQDTYKDKFSNYATDLGFDADTYLEYKAQDFSADKDKNGKSISGSKKRKVFDYVNSLDIPYEQKLLLAKSEYNSFNDNNYEIIEYIENSGMDYDERIELYKALGFKVDGDSISW